MKRELLVLLCYSFLFFNCSSYNKKASKENKMQTDIKLTLSANHLKFYFSNRDELKLTMTATNPGHEVIKPDLSFTKLIVNEKESLIWAEAIGNGIRESKWYALPSGDSTAFTLSMAGNQLFPQNGKYTLKLCLRDIESNTIIISVLKDE